MSYTKITYHLSPDTHLLFIGINPSPGTYRRGVPFSNNKSFWYQLLEAGLLDEEKTDLQHDRLLKEIFRYKLGSIYHMGILNLVYRPTERMAQVTKDEARLGAKRIVTAIKQYRPSVVCFIGKGTYELFSGKKNQSYGWQEDIGASRIFVMHSPIHGARSIRIKELRLVGKAAGLLD